MHQSLDKMDSKEINLPETVFIRDIETKVFQSIVLRLLSDIEGIETLEGNLFHTLLGDSLDGIKGIHVDQDQKNHSVNVRIEVNVAYGICIPEKAEEIQTKILQDISRLTSLHVGSVHVIFKNLISSKQLQKGEQEVEEVLQKHLPHPHP